MSPEVIAAILGVLSGVLIERLARQVGRLWCETSDLVLKPLSQTREQLAWGDYSEVALEDARWLDYSFSLDLFNGKEIPDGLRNPRVVLVCESGQLDDQPLDASTYRRPDSHSVGTYDRLAVLNLPPRQWERKELKGRFGPEEYPPPDKPTPMLAKWKRLDFVAERHQGSLFQRKVFRKTIATRGDAERPWWRRLFGG